MNTNLKCFLGFHVYEIYKEEDVKRFGTDLIVGKVIISRCKNCGKIKYIIAPLTTNTY